MTRGNLKLSLLGVAFLVGTAWAQVPAMPQSPGKAALADEDVKRLLLLMNIDKDGKISKQEWLKFMEAEFDRLDKGKKGELDPKDVLRSSRPVKQVRSSDLGK